MVLLATIVFTFMMSSLTLVEISRLGLQTGWAAFTVIKVIGTMDNTALSPSFGFGSVQ